MKHVTFGQRRIRLPQSRLARMVLGAALVLGGLLGFLPVLGFWMIPLGLIVLSVDLPLVRRLRRRVTVRLIGIWRRAPHRNRRRHARVGALRRQHR